ncbi:MAG: alpha/beta fold hydrolase [Marinobacter sp.]|nr:alpha/beta fold hydrolase [Marinobacter sp.]
MSTSTETFMIAARDGAELACTLFQPTEATRGAVLLCSATAVKRNYYAAFAQHLAEQGFICMTLDYRGIGESLKGPIREFQGQVRDWGEKDLASAIDWLAEQYPDLPLLAVCHSIGGQILMLADNNHQLDGILNVGVQSGYWGLWEGFEKWKLFTLWHVTVPSLTKLLGYFPSKRLGVGEDLPTGIISEWTSWCKDPDYMFGKSAPESIRNAENIQCQIAAYSFTDDTIAPKANVEFMNQRFRAPLRYEHVAPQEVGLKKIGHFGAFRSKVGPALWPRFVSDLQSFLEPQTPTNAN